MDIWTNIKFMLTSGFSQIFSAFFRILQSGGMVGVFLGTFLLWQVFRFILQPIFVYSGIMEGDTYFGIRGNNQGRFKTKYVDQNNNVTYK